MFDLVGVIFLSNLFVVSIILVVVLGILILEFLERSRENRYGIIHLGITNLVSMVWVSLYAFEFIENKTNRILDIVSILILIFLVIFGSWIFFILRKKSNINFFIAAIVFVIIIVCVKLLLDIWPNENLVLLNSVSSFLATLSFYLFVMDFLIKSSKNKLVK